MSPDPIEVCVFPHLYDPPKFISLLSSLFTRRLDKLFKYSSFCSRERSRHREYISDSHLYHSVSLRRRRYSRCVPQISTTWRSSYKRGKLLRRGNFRKNTNTDPTWESPKVTPKTHVLSTHISPSFHFQTRNCFTPLRKWGKGCS